VRCILIPTDLASSKQQPRRPTGAAIRETDIRLRGRVHNSEGDHHHVMFLLENYPKFNLGLIDDKEGEQLGWKSRNVHWLVQGRDKVMFEIDIDNNIDGTNLDSETERLHNTKREKDEPLTLQLNINNESIA
jgi:hypothetical protein